MNGSLPTQLPWVQGRVHRGRINKGSLPTHFSGVQGRVDLSCLVGYQEWAR